MMRARGIQSVSSPSIRWPMLSKGLNVSGPSVPRTHGVLTPCRSARNAGGVRSRTSVASRRSKSTSARPPFEMEQMRNAVNHWHEQQSRHHEKDPARVEGEDPGEYLTAVTV